MFICSCLAIADRTVEAAIAAGSATVQQVTERCGAGGNCRGCWPELQRLLDEHDLRPGGSHRHSAA